MAATTKGNGWVTSTLIAKKWAQIKNYLSLGGAPGALATTVMLVKNVTGLTDTTATAVLTITVPNAAHTAVINVDALGVLGAGGAVGAGECSKLAKYQVVVTRTAALAAVITVSSAIGGVQSKVAGADSITSTVVTASAVSGANSVTQTFTVKVAITKGGGSSDNHTCLVYASCINQNANGVTMV